MENEIPAPIIDTTVPAKVTSVGEKLAVLTIRDSEDVFRIPTKTLPLGVGTGATVYVRILSESSLDNEIEAVSRKVLEQFLN